MFSHIMVGANDIEKSKIFYDNVLGVLGAKPGTGISAWRPNPGQGVLGLAAEPFWLVFLAGHGTILTRYGASLTPELQS